MSLTDADLDRIERFYGPGQEPELRDPEVVDLVAEVRRLRAFVAELVPGARGTITYGGIAIEVDEQQPRNVVTLRDHVSGDEVHVSLTEPLHVVDAERGTHE